MNIVLYILGLFAIAFAYDLTTKENRLVSATIRGTVSGIVVTSAFHLGKRTALRAACGLEKP